MATVSKSHKPVRKPAHKARRRAESAVEVKFPADHPFAGLEHVFGAVSLDLPPAGPKRRAHLRARILADHNT